MSQDQLSNARWGFLELRKLYTLRLGCDASAAWVIWEPTVGPSLVLPPLLLWQAALATSGYAGADACRNCHRAEFDAQSRSAHARSLAHSQPPQPGDWAFGAGEQAITFVRRLNSEYYLEEGETWYRALAGFARTPGHVSSGGVRDRIFDPSATILRCFACHSTGRLRIDATENIVPGELGVRCEVCHGPAAGHAREPDRFHPQNPARMPADELNRFCGECHRMPARTKDTANLRDPWNVRHQPPMLAASACFRKSQGRLSCLTCHSPHAPLERNLAAYNSICGRCHIKPQHKANAAGRPCAACHMPAVEPQPHLRFANHRIAVYAPADPMSPLNVRR